MTLSDIGKMAENFWNEMPQHYPHVDPDEFIVMPDHIHGIITINNNVRTEDIRSGQANEWTGAKSGSISAIVRGFKIAVTKYCGTTNQKFEWQKSFYDHIIRSEESLDKIRSYIFNNLAALDSAKKDPDNYFE